MQIYPLHYNILIFFLYISISAKIFKMIRHDNFWLMVRVFANGAGDLGSVSGRVIPKTQKMVLDASLLNHHYYKVWIKVKWVDPGKGVAPSPTPWCSSYRKGSLQVTLDYSHQLYFYKLASMKILLKNEEIFSEICNLMKIWRQLWSSSIIIISQGRQLFNVNYWALCQICI